MHKLDIHSPLVFIFLLQYIARPPLWGSFFYSYSIYYLRMQLSKTKTNLSKEQAHLVFYDDRCSLCTAEINHYKKLKKLHPIQWIGIHKNEDIVHQYCFTQEQLLERLHVVQENGETHIGASAFITIWLSIKRYRWIGLTVQKLRLTPMLNYFYEYFAKRRYQKRICKI